jgi:hypothetical protein
MQKGTPIVRAWKVGVEKKLSIAISFPGDPDAGGTVCSVCLVCFCSAGSFIDYNLVIFRRKKFASAPSQIRFWPLLGGDVPYFPDCRLISARQMLPRIIIKPRAKQQQNRAAIN